MSEQDQPNSDPISNPTGPLTDHAYDGIREYDNPLPGWWTWIFVGTIIFSAVYFYCAITSGQLSAVTEYDRSVIEETAREFQGVKLAPDATTILRIARDEKSRNLRDLGASIFQTNCVSCHGTHAEGFTCPNQTDDYYLDVKKVTDFVDVISRGRNNGAMPAWGNKLSPNEIIVVSGYLASLRGTNYPTGRKPEGTIPPPWTER